ncbi:MAG: 5'/3'-nucleotidase SurE [Anaerolineales bacterium]|nr:5'/3'-nucleotidase SurE [Anaerolineales bacterium]
MSQREDIQILLTNDDGIQSPGLWMAARTLSEIGFVNVVAPRDQFSGAGRSLPSNSDGLIRPQPMHVNGKDWTVYAVGGTPAQAIQHAVLEILPRKPDLVVSGINYGENLGTAITISGTVGAALEGAALGIPSLAISLETGVEYHLSYSQDIDFSTAGYFAAYFGRLLLRQPMPFDVDVLKVDVPRDATPETPWEVSRLSRRRYYEPVQPQRRNWDEPGLVAYRLSQDAAEHEKDTDVHILAFKRRVAVTPLSLDMTSRLDLKELSRFLHDLS